MLSENHLFDQRRSPSPASGSPRFLFRYFAQETQQRTSNCRFRVLCDHTSIGGLRQRSRRTSALRRASSQRLLPPYPPTRDAASPNVMLDQRKRECCVVNFARHLTRVKRKNAAHSSCTSSSQSFSKGTMRRPICAVLFRPEPLDVAGSRENYHIPSRKAGRRCPKTERSALPNACPSISPLAVAA